MIFRIARRRSVKTLESHAVGEVDKLMRSWPSRQSPSTRRAGLLTPSPYQVARRLVKRLVAGDGRDADELDLRGRDREEDGHRVVVAGVAVDDDPRGHNSASTSSAAGNELWAPRLDAGIGSTVRLEREARFARPFEGGVREQRLRERGEEFRASGFARGLETLAYLAREQEKKEVVREFLLENLNNKKERVQMAVLNALGTLGDAKAIPVLEKFASASKESPERSAAEKAITSLRDSRKSSVELGSLRNEVLSLQKENRDLRKEFDDLKKRMESALPQAGTVTTNKPTSFGKRGR